MSKAKIRLACGPYDRTSAVVHGRVKLSGMDLEVLEMNETAKMFAGMIAGDYDASEMSLAELMTSALASGGSSPRISSLRARGRSENKGFRMC